MESVDGLIKVGIVGGAGYTAGELLRLLIHHNGVSIDVIQSKSNAGKKIGAVHHDLFYSYLKFSDQIHFNLDVIFLCAGHGEAIKFINDNKIPNQIKIIDLSHDFRLNASSISNGKTFTYGLPELNRDNIAKAQNIANPGCFATAIQLGLLPLASKGLLRSIIHTTGITGSTGAGQSLSATSHFSWRSNNIQAYKTLTHQHLGEITESIIQAGADKLTKINFIPWRGDFTRGIFISSIMPSEKSIEYMETLYEEYYKYHPFTHYSKDPIHLKQVVNTNHCIINIEKQGDQLVVHSAIDNLVKGASGQAIQNMNIMFDLPETAGLLLKANNF
jgi:N-acetyl-gamma-glutamyl-phosphate reductase